MILPQIVWSISVLLEDEGSSLLIGCTAGLQDTDTRVTPKSASIRATSIVKHDNEGLNERSVYGQVENSRS